MPIVPPRHVPVPALLPKPKGDPAAMDELASECRRHAHTIAMQARGAMQAVDSMNFRAPAASRIRGRVRGNYNANTGTAAKLSDFATRLQHGADELRTEIKAYEQRLTDRANAIAHNKLADQAAEDAKNPLLKTPLF